MISNIYQVFLRNAAVALFVAFLLVLCGSFAALLSGYMLAANGDPLVLEMDGYWLAAISVILRAFLESFQLAALILAAAALIFRADKWLEAAE